jgi:serine/threonine protein kinase
MLQTALLTFMFYFSYLHAKSIIHRDLKSNSILLFQSSEILYN